jgi:hypothetical protein
LRITSDRKINANRTNARASTGPKTTRGSIRSARNAFRHGLSLPIYWDPELSEGVEALAREIAGKDTNAELLMLARRIAEAQIDLRRVRDARHQLMSQALNDPHYDSRSNMRKKVTLLGRLLKPNAPEVPVAALEKYVTTTPQGPQKLAVILSEEIQKLSVMDREVAMSKSLVIIAAALVMMSAGLSNGAEAGASASAATKYSTASASGYQAWTRWWRTHRTGTSEYSSSNRSPRR